MDSISGLNPYFSSQVSLNCVLGMSEGFSCKASKRLTQGGWVGGDLPVLHLSSFTSLLQRAWAKYVSSGLEEECCLGRSCFSPWPQDLLNPPVSGGMTELLGLKVKQVHSDRAASSAHVSTIVLCLWDAEPLCYRVTSASGSGVLSWSNEDLSLVLIVGGHVFTQSPGQFRDNSSCSGTMRGRPPSGPSRGPDKPWTQPFPSSTFYGLANITC